MRVALLLAVVLAVASCDKAEDGFHQCERLEDAGHLAQAVAACDEAHAADPTTKYGRLAWEKAAAIQSRLDEVVPDVVTAEWCGRLRRRLEGRLSSNADTKYGGSGGNVGAVIHDHVHNLESDCKQDVGTLGSPPPVTGRRAGTRL